MSYSVLRPQPQPLALALLFSVAGHGGVIILFLLFGAVMSRCAPSRPIIDVEDAIEVSMVVLPKSKTAMPNRATHVPMPKAPAPPVPSPKPPVAPPIRQSELAVPTPEAPPTKGAPDRTADMQKAMEDLMRDAALDSLMGVAGTVDQMATDPNSTSDEAINATGPGLAADPEYARYISKLDQLFKANFRPLAAVTQANPDLKTVVFVTVEPTSGRLLSASITQPSGNALFDDAALTAAQSVSQVPMPPEKYRARMAGGYEFTYTSSD